MGGWIKLYDKMLDWEWYGDTNVVRVFLHCLLKANYQSKHWQGITIERGQFVAGRETLADETGLTVQQVRTALEKLKKTGEITIKPTNKYSIITVCEYAKYQANEMVGNQQVNQQITNNQPTNNQQITTTTEYIEYKDNTDNIKSDTKVSPKSKAPSRFIKPTLEEVRTYCSERNNSVDPERFIAYYESNGWKVGRNAMKDWKAAVRTWEGKEKQHVSVPKEDLSRALFDAQMEEHRKKVVAEREAKKEQEMQEKRHRDDQKLLDIIFNNQQ